MSFRSIHPVDSIKACITDTDSNPNEKGQGKTNHLPALGLQCLPLGASDRAKNQGSRQEVEPQEALTAVQETKIPVSSY